MLKRFLSIIISFSVALALSQGFFPNCAYAALVWTETRPAGDANKKWASVASDDDGSNLIAGVYGGRLYTSSDSGANWTERQPAGAADKSWRVVASDSDGSNLIAAVNNGRLYTGVPATAPTLTISAASSITTTSATLNGDVTATGGENPTVTVYWGDNDGLQVAGNWDNNSAPTNPGQPQGVAAFTKDVTALTPGTTYYFSAKATNSGGTGWPAASLTFNTDSSGGGPPPAPTRSYNVSFSSIPLVSRNGAPDIILP